MLPKTISAYQYTSLVYSTNTVAEGIAKVNPTRDNLMACFTTEADYKVIGSVRDMATIGRPANIVNVPTYGVQSTLSVNAQADAVSASLVLNWIPEQHKALPEGEERLFQLAMLPQATSKFNTDSTTGGFVGKKAAIFYFWASIDGLLLTPARDDAATLEVTISQRTDMHGPFYVDGFTPSALFTQGGAPGYWEGSGV